MSLCQNVIFHEVTENQKTLFQCPITVCYCLVNEKQHWVPRSPVWALHNKPHVTKLNFSCHFKYHNSIPGVYYTIIHSARKQIPLTWFLFNYSTWKSFTLTLFSPNLRKEKLLYPLKTISTYWRIAFLPACQIPFTRTHLQPLFYLNLSKCGTQHNGASLR